VKLFQSFYRKALLIITLSLPLLTAMSGPDGNPQWEPDVPTDTSTVFIPVLYVGHPPPPSPNRAIIIDHNSIYLFDRIPNNYIQAAANMSVLFRHASVGWNISYGLDCLMNRVQPRPSGCYGPYDPKYNRTNWIFEFHQPPPAQNPGWWEKVDLFIHRIENLSPAEDYNVVGYKHGYVDAYDGSTIDSYFFVDSEPFSGIADLEALASRHAERKFMLWTMSLARRSYPESANFNRQMRDYARANNKILMDIAAITSHRPDGTPCYSTLGNGVEAICADYTTEEGGGHLTGLGSYRMAQAMWVLMARLAGWNP